MTKDAVLNDTAQKALRELHNGGVLQLARDKVTDAYLGQWGSAETIEKTRARIHWIVSQVKGDKVLDIGTSEGITAILLAREGHTVTGIDVNAAAIKHAINVADSEDEKTKSRINLMVGNIFDIENPGKFDTIIIGEVIEHICNISRFVSNLRNFANENARIILTTPFGVFPDRDHKHSLFIHDIWKYLSPLGHFSHLSSVDGYIRAVIDLDEETIKAPPRQPTSDVAELLLATSEEASYQAQVKLFRLIDEARRALNIENNQRRDRERDISSLRDELSKTQKLLEKSEFNIEKNIQESDNLKIELISANKSIEYLESTHRIDISEFERRIDELRVQISDKDKYIEKIKKETSDFAETRNSLDRLMNSENELNNKLNECDRIISYSAQSARSIQTLLGDIFKIQENPASTFMKFESVRGDTITLKPRVMFETTCEVTPGSSYRLILNFHPNYKPNEKNAALVQVRYYTEDRIEIPGPYPHTQNSKSVGEYRYLYPVENGSHSVRLQLAAPLTATSMKLCVRAWRPSSRLKLYNRLELAAEPTTTLAPQIHTITRVLKKMVATLEATRNLTVAAPSQPTKPQGLAGQMPAPQHTVPAKALTGDLSPAILHTSSTSEASEAPLIVPCILDEMSQASWRSEYNLLQIPRHGWRNWFQEIAPDFALLESCWNGNGGEWQYAFTSPNLQHPNAVELLELLSHLKQSGVKTVFWNKEDPMHFAKFLPIASKSDFIFTTDARCVEAYREAVPSAHVATLPFAASLDICNPTDRFRKEAESVCFAGAYYPDGHDERLHQMEYVLPAIENFNGAIYDRYSNHPTDRYRFPSRYQPFIRNAVPFDKMAKIYRNFNVFLNVNTITDSPTMMSRRVYELLASGTPVVSSPSDALAAQFEGIVKVGSTEGEITQAVDSLLSDQHHWNRTSQLGIRAVANAHTYQHRASTISSAIGATSATNSAPLISIVVASCRAKNIDRIISNISHQAHPRLEVALALTPDFNESDIQMIRSRLGKCGNIENIEVLVFGSEVTLGRCLNEAIRSSSGEYIAKMDDDNIYLPKYLSDLMIPFAYDDYDVVGKESYFCYLGGMNKLIWRFPEKRFCRTKFVAGDAMILRRRVFERTSFPEKRVGEDTKLLKDIALSGGLIYSADHFNFVKYRAADLADHTWRETEENLLKRSVVIASSLDTKIVEL